ncbi:D-hexose-6-phosphate mutarotase [Tolypothrix campylonemoides VB511288]|nr:D-hexose-6-phosphate mutarotase [Tolypothrix campylonemoides VB511288]
MQDPQTTIALGDATATIRHRGAQVVSWRHGGCAQLFVSERAVRDDRTPLRGGIPIIFPQFGARGPGRRHGFARTATWTRTALSPDRAAFALGAAPVDAGWPHDTLASLEVALHDAGRRLAVALTVENAGSAPVAFTSALHTYLAIDLAGGVTLPELADRDWRDSREATDTPLRRDALHFGPEVDRLYPDAPATVTLTEAGRPRLQIGMSGFTDIVVWNPGATLAATLADLGEEAASRFVCVEPAAAERPVRMAPGGVWRGVQSLTIV